MFSKSKVFISKTFFTFAAILAGEFANFANSNTHPLAKRHLTSRYNEHLYLTRRQRSASARHRTPDPAEISDRRSPHIDPLDIRNRPQIGTESDKIRANPPLFD